MIPEHTNGQLSGRMWTRNYDPPLMKLLPVHSTCVVTITFVLAALAHIIQVLVFTENTPPLGTSGVLVVVIVTT